MTTIVDVDPPFVEAKLYAFFQPDFTANSRQVLTPDPGPPGKIPMDQWKGTVRAKDRRVTNVHNARRLQASAPYSPGQFFEDYGFVLLPHRSQVSDWDADFAAATVATDISQTYYAEIEQLISLHLLPGKALDIHHADVGLVPGQTTLRRGRDKVGYVPFVHADYGLTDNDYQESAEAWSSAEAALDWREQYDDDRVEGFLIIDFWRVVDMATPVRFLPLAVCDPRSVNIDDIVPTSLISDATGKPNNMMALRFNDGQRWYYYPNMTGGEVLAFKSFQCAKSDHGRRLKACFHTAFEEPGAPEDAERRQSFEHRAGVFILKS